MKKLYIQIALSLFTFINIYSQNNCNLHEPVPMNSTIKNGSLANEIKYVIWPHAIPKNKAFIYAYIGVGNLEEHPSEFGLAHLIEHLHFKLMNEKARTEFNYLKRLGLSGVSDLNAHTLPRCTYYDVLNIPLENNGIIASSLLYLKELIFNPDIDNAESIDLERNVVIEEWRLKHDAESRMSLLTEMTAFHGTCLARQGNDTSDLKNVSHSRIKEFHKQWYNSGNLTLIAIGDFNPEVVELGIKQIFGSEPKTLCTQPRSKQEILKIDQPQIAIASDSEAPFNKVELIYKHDKDSVYTQGQLRKDYIDKLISHMINRRLALIANRPNESFVKAKGFFEYGFFSLNNYNRYECYAQGHASPQLILKSLLVENEKIKRYNFSELEFKEAKDWLSNIYTSDLISSLPSGEMFMKYYAYLEYGKIPVSIDYEKKFVTDLLKKLTLKEIKARFNEYTTNNQPYIFIKCLEKDSLRIPTHSEISEIFHSASSLKIDSLIFENIHEVDRIPHDESLKKGIIIKESFNNSMGTTEWILSNGMRVILKRTAFKPDEVAFCGLRNGTYPFKKDFHVLFSHPFSLENSRVNGWSYNQIKQMLSGSKLKFEYLYSASRQGVQGNCSILEMETALRFINYSFSEKSWSTNDTIWLSLSMAGLDPVSSKMIKDSVDFYTGNILLENSQIIPRSKINTFSQWVFCDPSQFTFIFSGNIDLTKARSLIEKYLASISSKEKWDNLKLITTSNEIKTRPNWNTGTKSCVFSRSMNNPRTVLVMYCQGRFSPTYENRIYCSMAQNFVYKAISDTIRNKYGALYSAGPFYNITEPDFGQFSLTFGTDPKKSELIRNVTHTEFQKLMEKGIDEGDFSVLKTRLLNQRQKDLMNNQWWSTKALPEFYFNNCNIVPTYLNEVKNLSLDNLTNFTRGIYRQGNIIEVVLNAN